MRRATSVAAIRNAPLKPALSSSHGSGRSSENVCRSASIDSIAVDVDVAFVNKPQRRVDQRMPGIAGRIAFDAQQAFEHERPSKPFGDCSEIAILRIDDSLQESERRFDDRRVGREAALRQNRRLDAGARRVAGMQGLRHRAHVAAKAAGAAARDADGGRGLASVEAEQPARVIAAAIGPTRPTCHQPRWVGPPFCRRLKSIAWVNLALASYATMNASSVCRPDSR